MRKRTDEREWKESLLLQLPENAGKKLERFAKDIPEIQPKMIIYRRESVPETNGYLIEAGLMGFEEEKYHWGARCLCTACGGEFTAGWNDGSFVLLQMEDGLTLDGWTDCEQPEAAAFKEGGYALCPLCSEEGIARRRSSIRGRTFRTQVMEMTNIGSTTCLIYWLASYYLEKDGYHWEGMQPRMAVAISPEGRIYRFSHSTFFLDAETDKGSWKAVKEFRDPEGMPFNEGGDMYRNTIGAYYFMDDEDMTGKTGEKTGIQKYLEYQEATYAAEYLKIWEKNPYIENLVTSGAAPIVNGAVVEWEGRREMKLNLREAKPHKALGVNREEYRLITARGWTLYALQMFKEYRNIHPKTTAREFQAWEDLAGSETIEHLRPVWNEGFERIHRYLQKQYERADPGNIDLYYVDYRRMLTRIREGTGETGDLTAEERFPPDLVQAHNRLVELTTAMDREEKRIGTATQRKTFAEMKKQLSALEWQKDGLCILIPSAPGDLYEEGKTLHHCVGGYANEHCSGRMIFFVRHARRPERSWYTLNENINGSKVNRIQLHGYRNERNDAGDELKIPQRVTDFVTEWEKTVLAPYLENTSRRKLA